MPENSLDIWAGKRTIKRFRVAREGQTVDGRVLSQQDIIDIAETYDPVEYTARINVEHMGGLSGLESTQYPALGDVIACDCQLETFFINNQKVDLMCLYATLSALPILVEANKKGQKLFTSIEYYKKFADTGRAYLVGLAVTDTPASRGTQPLKFTHSKNDTFASNFMEMTMLDSPNSTPPKMYEACANLDKKDSLVDKLSALFSKKNGLSAEQEEAILHGFSELLNTQNNQEEQILSLQNDLTALSTQHQTLQTAFDALQQDLARQTVETQTPEVGTGSLLTDF